ncbi:MAG: three-Cys-motif partner protein TcmP [Paludibacteraceae bacterium]|nr:three-Cys-motif partner protein TcmP [Paludibacteraceae bacterium]
MGVKDLHRKPFDDGTNCKLDIFETYTQEWLPVPIMSKYFKACCIYDLFAGPGYDLSNKKGSPIRILSQILLQSQNILNTQTKVGLWFNEADKAKYNLLVENCNKFVELEPQLKQLKELNLLKIKYSQSRFEDIFDSQILPALQKCPSLLFLDQNGIKHLNKFEKLVGIKHLDFLYFVSSSYYARFGETKQFKDVLDVDMDNLRALNYKDIHEIITGELRGHIPSYSDMKIYPFSIKKDQNIFGIVFGSSNTLGVDKFLRTTWNINPINGTANFDIEDDTQKVQLDIFEGKRLTKIEKFQEELKQNILNANITDNEQAYLFTLSKGHIPVHANDSIKQLKAQELITYEGRTPAVNYDNVYKKHHLVAYKLINK